MSESKMLSAKNQSIQRIIVNSILLVYWLPAVSNDLKYPTQDEYKMTQILILFHLIISIVFDATYLDGGTVKYLTAEWNWTEGYLDQRYSYHKNLKDQIAQMTIDIAVLFSLNFIILDLCIYKVELSSYHFHENFSTLLILLMSCSVSDIEFTISGAATAFACLWLFIVHEFIAYLNGKIVYPYIAWSDEQNFIDYRRHFSIYNLAFLLPVELIIIHIVIFQISKSMKSNVTLASKSALWSKPQNQCFSM